ncbi:MAG: LuxR C-terminal-related transcriptional regulator [Opitutaceae bacterium]
MPPSRAGLAVSKKQTAPVCADAPATRLCLILALHGKALPPGCLETLEITDGAVDAVMSAGQVVEQSTGFILSKGTDPAPLIAKAPWSTRRQLHLALAQACLNQPVRLEDAARHLEAAGSLAQAARAWLSAADVHCRRHRHKAAGNCFAAGLRLLPAETNDAGVESIIERIGQCASLCGEVTAAIELLEEWGNTPPWAGRPAVRAATQLALAPLLTNVQHHAGSGRARMRAARDLASLERHAEAAAAANAAAHTLSWALQFNAAIEAGEFAREAARTAGDPAAEAEAFLVLGFTFGALGRTADGFAEMRRALDIALTHRLTGLAANAYRVLGYVNEYASRYGEQQKAFAQAIDFCRRYDQSEIAELCLGCLSVSYFRSGSWKRSETTARSVIDSRTAPPVSKAVAEGVLGLLHAYRGSSRPAIRMLENCATACRAFGVLAIEFLCLLGKAVIEETAGRSDQVSRHLLALMGFWRETEDRHDAIPGLTHGVVHFAALGQREEAAEFAEALDRIAGGTANFEAIAAAQLGAAELSLLDGDAPGAVRLLRKAIENYDRCDLSIEHIRARMRLGAALRAAGETQEAATAFSDALQHARRLGARPLVARLEALLETPAESAAAPAGLWETLSPRQREVARVLARGWTNKEIASELNLSVRTVDMHVAHIFARLDCRTRTEAAARIAADLG